MALEWTKTDQAYFDAGVDELFNLLWEKKESGEITLEQVGAFFPADIQRRNFMPTVLNSVPIESIKIVEGIEGVCCMCQRTHPLIQNPQPDPRHVDDDFFGEEIGYLLAPHSNYADIYADPTVRKTNPHLLMCPGAGTVPQVLVRE